MLPAIFLGKPVFVREIMPQDLKFEIRRISIDDAKSIAKYLAYIVGLAHARRLSQLKRKAWLAELSTQPIKNIGRAVMALEQCRCAGSSP